MVASLDWVAASLALYLLLPAEIHVGFPTFLAMFMAAQIAGIVSNVPGGLGVFETCMLAMLSGGTRHQELLAALIAFRCVYYLVPLALAAILLIGVEGIRIRSRLGPGLAWTRQFVGPLVPLFAASLAFLAGVMLLLSCSTRGLPHRLEWLAVFVPLGLVEASHFLSSLAGVALLLLARGLRHRFDAAYHIALALLGSAAVLSLLKGLDFEETGFLLAVAALLLPVRSHFPRRSRLRDLELTPAWIGSIVIVLVGAFWLGIFSYKHVEYRSELWWNFTLHGNASRFLRASVGVAALLFLFSLWKLLGPARVDRAERATNPDDMEDLRGIARTNGNSNAHLALVGDKSILFHPSRRSFLMYRAQGRSLVCMGDPVGNPDDWPDLVWQFKSLCDHHAATPVFYEVSPGALPLYIDVGLVFLKLGEEALIDLGTFDFDAHAHKAMRSNHRRLAREGIEFVVLPPEDAAKRMTELRAVSDDWLAAKGAREKGFSLGYFKEEYIASCSVAAALQEGRIVAFANQWEAGEREELSIDLMRYSSEAPKGVMDYLFASILLRAKEDGWRRFNLGMAPLSGLEARPLAPFWAKAERFLYLNGESLYNFQGLRQYKDKFRPSWSPRYLACPGGLAIPRVLADLAFLISGGATK